MTFVSEPDKRIEEGVKRISEYLDEKQENKT
jgi:hypothetical protein